jgi:hypothetical protein
MLSILRNMLDKCLHLSSILYHKHSLFRHQRSGLEHHNYKHCLREYSAFWCNNLYKYRHLCTTHILYCRLCRFLHPDKYRCNTGIYLKSVQIKVCISCTDQHLHINYNQHHILNIDHFLSNIHIHKYKHHPRV